MKYLRLLIIGSIGLLFAACDKTLPEVVLYDFTGTYVGALDCTGELEEDYGEAFSFTVDLLDEESRVYLLTFEDDLTMKARQAGNLLIIDRQIYNEGGTFDVVTMQGSISLESNSTFVMEFFHTVDDEGDSNCETALTKN